MRQTYRSDILDSNLELRHDIIEKKGLNWPNVPQAPRPLPEPQTNLLLQGQIRLKLPGPLPPLAVPRMPSGLWQCRPRQVIAVALERRISGHDLRSRMV